MTPQAQDVHPAQATHRLPATQAQRTLHPLRRPKDLDGAEVARVVQAQLHALRVGGHPNCACAPHARHVLPHLQAQQPQRSAFAQSAQAMGAHMRGLRASRYSRKFAASSVRFTGFTISLEDSDVRQLRVEMHSRAQRSAAQRKWRGAANAPVEAGGGVHAHVVRARVARGRQHRRGRQPMLRLVPAPQAHRTHARQRTRQS
jgi:hypothetical protein